MESSRTSLASRTHFEVLGLEASSPRKLACPRLEDSTIFEPLKFRWKMPETLRKVCKDLFFWFPQVEIAWKKILKTFSPEKNSLRPFFLRSPEKKFGGPFIFWRTLASVFLVLGLERVCPRPWSRNFFVSLALALVSSFVSSTPPLVRGCRYFSGISVRISFEVTLTCQLQAKYHLYHILFEPVLPSALKKISTKFRIFTKIVLNSEN